IMLRFLFGLLGVDLDHKIAEIRAQIEDFKARTTHQLGEQVKEAGLMVGFAFIGVVAAIATFMILLVALYRWVDLYKGPFAALAAVGAVMALLAIVMFLLAFRRGSSRPESAVSDTRLAAASAPPTPPPPEGVPVALSAALPPPPPNATLLDLLTHRFSTRVAVAGDEAIDAAV